MLFSNIRGSDFAYFKVQIPKKTATLNGLVLKLDLHNRIFGRPTIHDESSWFCAENKLYTDGLLLPKGGTKILNRVLGKFVKNFNQKIFSMPNILILCMISHVYFLSLKS